MFITRVIKKLNLKVVSGGRFSKFIGYAIIEVLLIVAGVLIAVQINNRVETEKLKNTQINVLKDIQNALDFERLRTEGISTLHDSLGKYAQVFLDFLEGRIPYPEELNPNIFHIGSAVQFKPKMGPFEELQNFGFHTITNEELRLGILNLYESDFGSLELYTQNMHEQFNQQILPRLIKYFDLEETRLHGDGRIENAFKVKSLINEDHIRADHELIQLIKIAILNHYQLASIARTVDNIRQHHFDMLDYDIQYLETGINPKKMIKFNLEGFQDAKSVLLVGSFNDWSQNRNFMDFKNGAWSSSIQLYPGDYEYKFIVDGKWINDPANDNKVFIPGVGSYNSVLVVEE